MRDLRSLAGVETRIVGLRRGLVRLLHQPRDVRLYPLGAEEGRMSEIDRLTVCVVELTKVLNILLKPNKERICE